MRSVVGEADRARGCAFGLLQPYQLRLRVDEAADQPGAGETVRPHRLARCPGSREELLLGAERRLRLRREEQLLHRRIGIGERALGASTPRAGEEIERGDVLELAPLLGEHARDGARVGLAEADAQALDDLDQLLVAPRAVAHAHERLLLRRRARAPAQQLRVASALAGVVDKRLERLA